MLTDQGPRLLRGDNYAVLRAGAWECYYGHSYRLGPADDAQFGRFYAACDRGWIVTWEAEHGEGWPPVTATTDCLLYGMGLWLQARDAAIAAATGT